MTIAPELDPIIVQFDSLRFEVYHQVYLIIMVLNMKIERKKEEHEMTLF